MGSRCFHNNCQFNNMGECGANNPAIIYSYSKVYDIWNNCKDEPTRNLVGLLLLDSAESFASVAGDTFFKAYLEGGHQRKDIDDQSITEERAKLIKYVVTNYPEEIISDPADLAQIFD